MGKATADELIRLLQLEPLPFEGGFYRETFRSIHEVDGAALPPAHGASRSLSTAILYMITPSSFSWMHRLDGDEIYHFYLGDPVELVELHPDGHVERHILGTDLGAGQKIQHVVRADVWQGSRLLEGGDYALMGTTMAPGFTLDDFELGVREELVPRYGHEAEIVTALTLPRGEKPR